MKIQSDIQSELIHNSKEYRRLVIWCWFHIQLGTKLYSYRSEKLYPLFFTLDDMYQLNKLPVKKMSSPFPEGYTYKAMIYMPSARSDLKTAALLDALHYEQLRIRSSLTSRL